MFDYIFAFRPSTVCNMNCKYCLGVDSIAANRPFTTFDIDAIKWHSDQFPNNVFSFCGDGETMLHPQFADIIIELSKITKVTWITNGTQFNTTKFNRILTEANLDNIYGIVVSAHFGQTDMNTYLDNLDPIISKLQDLRIHLDITAVVSNDNIGDILSQTTNIQKYRIKLQSVVDYTKSGTIVNTTLTNRTRNLLRLNNLRMTNDANPVLTYPVKGKPCPNGSKIFEVLTNGSIVDCSYDTNQNVIGNINTKETIKAIQHRLCNFDCSYCCDMVRGGYIFNHGGFITSFRK